MRVEAMRPDDVIATICERSKLVNATGPER